MSENQTEKFKILAVLREPEARETLAEIIKRRDDVKLSQLLTLESVPKMLRGATFDLVVLDMDEPDTDVGLVISQVKELNPHQNIILLTSNPDPETITFAMESGAIDYFRNPLDDITINKILRNHKRRILESRQNLNLNNFIAYKHVKVQLPNDINILPQVANKITAEIYSAGIIKAAHIYNLNLAIFECLTNALEHGNLGIGYDRKTDYIKTGDYLQAVKELAREEKYKARRIHVEYTIDNEGVTIDIEDEGEGFDVDSYMKTIKSRSREDYHGRGLLLSMKMVDDLSFNETGNKITLRLNRGGRASLDEDQLAELDS